MMNPLRTVLSYAFAAAVLALFSLNAAAQITVDAGDLDALLGKNLEARISMSDEPESSEQLEAIVAADGEDDTYDFSGLTFDETINGRMRFTVPGPGIPRYDDPHFSQADLVVEMHFDDEESDTAVVAWSYSMIQEDGVYSLGIVMPIGDINDDGVVDTLAMDFDPPIFSSPLSYTYGDSWTIDDMFGEGETEVEVTGYGTLIAPDGTTRQALRVENTTSFFGMTMTTIEFITASDDGLPGVSASVDIGLTGEIMSVSFTEIRGEIGTSAEHETLPDRIALEQNYPNPFNPSTTIPFELSEPAHVTIEVFDMLGRQITTVVDDVRPAGQHTVEFDASRLPSGTYLYRMNSGTTEVTRVMTLLK